MKAVVMSIIMRLLAFITVYAFIFGIVFITKDMRYLWLLWLLPTAYIVPTYKFSRHYEGDKEKGWEVDEN